MKKSYNLSFLTERIKEIGSALMHDLDYENHPERLPANIITVLKADENGLLWFFIRKPFIQKQDHAFSFPASLQFLRKGKKFFIKITGIAHSTGNFSEVAPLVSSELSTNQELLSQLTLVEMKINSIEYCEFEAPLPQPTIKTWFQNVYNYIFNIPNYRDSVARITLN